MKKIKEHKENSSVKKEDKEFIMLCPFLQCMDCPSIGDFHPAWMDELEPKEEGKIRIMTVKDFSPKAVKVLFPN